MTIIGLLRRYNKSTISDDNGPWRQFVLDHADYIKENSELYSVGDQLINIYKYDLRRFLKDRMNRTEDIEWIFLIINDLKSDFDFDKTGNYWIPSDQFMIELFNNFQTSNR